MEFSAEDVFEDNGENADWNVKGGKVCLEVHEIRMAARIITKSIRFLNTKPSCKQGQVSLPFSLVFLR